MRHILTVTFSALMLAGCADGYDRSAGINDCKPAASAAHSVSHTDSSAWGTFSLPIDGIPGELPPGSNRTFSHGASANECVRTEDNKGGKPKTLDLQKLGAARSFGIELARVETQP
jgi:hypothetical protein